MAINLDDVIRGLRQLTKTPLESLVVGLENAASQLNRIDEAEALVTKARAAVAEENAKLNAVKVQIAQELEKLDKANADTASANAKLSKANAELDAVKKKLSSILA